MYSRESLPLINPNKRQRDKYLSEAIQGLRGQSYGTLEINGKTQPINYKKEVAHGGFKSFYDIGDGQLLVLRNTNVNINELTVLLWEEAIEFETKMSEKLHKLGLMAQDYKKTEVKINGHIVPALLVTHFNQLTKQGLQIRGGDDKEKFGTSLLFGSVDNIKNEAYLRALMKPLVNDIITLITNKIDLGCDSFDTLVIKNMHTTPSYDTNLFDTVLNRKQELHFYLIDFYVKYYLFQRGNLLLTDQHDKPNIEEINRVSRVYLNHAQSILGQGITHDEVKLLNFDSIATVVNLIEETFNKIEDSLLKEIRDSIDDHLKKGKQLPFSQPNPLKRSVSCHSFFSKIEDKSEADDIDLSLDDSESEDNDCSVDYKTLRNSVG